MHDGHYLTHREQFRRDGGLPPERIETLLDFAEAQPDVSCTIVYIEEAMSGLVAEDWAVELQSKLRDLHKSMRKSAAKEEVESILTYLDDFAMQQFYSADHSRSELRQALESLGHYRTPEKRPK